MKNRISLALSVAAGCGWLPTSQSESQQAQGPDAQEVDASFDASPFVVNGDYWIHTQSDVESLVDKVRITGDLIVNAPGPISLALPNLVQLDGDFRCGSHGLLACQLSQLALPSLVRAHDIRVCNAGSMRAMRGSLSSCRRLISVAAEVHELWFENVSAEIALGSLSTANRIVVNSNKTITALALPHLVSGTLSFLDSPMLATLDVPQFESGILEVAAVPLASLSLPSFSDGQLWVRAPLTTLSLPELASASFVSIVDTQLALLSVPKLATVTQWFAIGSNPELQTISAPVFTADTGTFDVRNNPLLPNCKVVELWTAAGYPDPTAISGNSTSCP